MSRILQKKRIIIFYSSSACVYNEFNQSDPSNPNCEESSAYPQIQIASTDGKLFSERLYRLIMGM